VNRRIDAELAISAGRKPARNPSPAHIGAICTECGLQAIAGIVNGRCIDRGACAKRAKEWE